MECPQDKQEQIRQLGIIHDNAWAKYMATKEILKEKSKLEKMEEEFEKIKEDTNKYLTFTSSYDKLKLEYQAPKYRMSNFIRIIFIIIYSLFGLSLLGMSGYQIVVYNMSLEIDVIEIVLKVIAYEIFLIVPGLYALFKFFIPR